jgi:hypothetical protein
MALLMSLPSEALVPAGKSSGAATLELVNGKDGALVA